MNFQNTEASPVYISNALAEYRNSSYLQLLVFHFPSTVKVALLPPTVSVVTQE